MIEQPFDQRLAEASPAQGRLQIDPPHEALVPFFLTRLAAEAGAAAQLALDIDAEQNVGAAGFRDPRGEIRQIAFDRLLVARHEGERMVLERLQAKRAPGGRLGAGDGANVDIGAGFSHGYIP